MKNKKVGFTLAEVLIALGIIGVAAALSMPALINNNKEKETVAKLKKINSVLNQAFTMAVNQYGPPNTWNFVTSNSFETDEEKQQNDYKGRDNVIKNLVPFLKTTFVCYYSGSSSCNNISKYIRNRYSLDGTSFNTWGTPRIILADGSTIDAVYMMDPQCKSVAGTSITLKNVCGQIFVDTNGIKPPNATGKDVFWFYLTSYGIVPSGMSVDTLRSFDNFCDISKKNELNGYGCAAWVIYNENMDYLKCTDLSWNGKKKCK